MSVTANAIASANPTPGVSASVTATVSARPGASMSEAVMFRVRARVKYGSNIWHQKMNSSCAAPSICMDNVFRKFLKNCLMFRVDAAPNFSRLYSLTL